MSQAFLKDQNEAERCRRISLLQAASILYSSGRFTSEGAVLQARHLEEWVEAATISQEEK
jgi:hypothetical protein